MLTFRKYTPQAARTATSDEWGIATHGSANRAEQPQTELYTDGGVPQVGAIIGQMRAEKTDTSPLILGEHMGEHWVDVDGGQLWTCAQGEGLPLMVCGGGPGLSDYLQPVADLLDDVATIVRWEQRGCGRSSPMGPYTIATCLADLEAIREAYGWERWVIAGHSYGADLALLYARAYPHRTLGLLCLAGGLVADDRGWHDTYHQRQHEEPAPATAYPPNMGVNRAIRDDWKQVIHDPSLLHDLAGCRVPALFVYGERDIRPSWAVEQVAHLLPSAEFVELAGADHYVWEHESQRLKELVRTFLGTL